LVKVVVGMLFKLLLDEDEVLDEELKALEDVDS
jgi:hypothetical protein